MLLISFGLPRPLWTPFELTIEVPTSNIQPDAATLTLHALNWLKLPIKSKCVVDVSKNKSKSKNNKSGGTDLWAILSCNAVSVMLPPKIPKTSPKDFRTKIVHTSGNIFDLWRVDLFDLGLEKYL